jgi:hypothetical protein
MISVQINNRGAEARNLPGCSIFAAFSFRYDAQLVPALLDNIRPYVDGWVSFDDRQATELFSNEPLRRSQLLDAAISAGASWILAIDPDERLESIAVQEFNRLATREGNVAWAFNIRDLFTPDSYRVDGIWGRKKMARLFPARTLNAATAKGLHAHWFDEGSLDIRFSDINLYHLKMISRSRRIGRRDLYKKLDPTNIFQARGYDYLVDDTTMKLETIPKQRGYFPPHIEDGELWMPKA